MYEIEDDQGKSRKILEENLLTVGSDPTGKYEIHLWLSSKSNL